jgi:hypothetical protein
VSKQPHLVSGRRLWGDLVGDGRLIGHGGKPPGGSFLGRFCMLARALRTNRRPLHFIQRRQLHAQWPVQGIDSG